MDCAAFRRLGGRGLSHTRAVVARGASATPRFSWRNVYLAGAFAFSAAETA